jgi:hypothetical protein
VVWIRSTGLNKRLFRVSLYLLLLQYYYLLLLVLRRGCLMRKYCFNGTRKIESANGYTFCLYDVANTYYAAIRYSQACRQYLAYLFYASFFTYSYENNEDNAYKRNRAVTVLRYRPSLFTWDDNSIDSHFHLFQEFEIRCD